MKSDVHVKLVFKWVLPSNESDIDGTITMKTKVRSTIIALIIQISAWMLMTVHLKEDIGL